MPLSHFRVRATKLYDVRTASVEEIFGASDEHLLNIITCAGSWDTRLGHYDQRFVVFAESTDIIL